MKDKLTIIVTLYKMEDFIDTCMKSLLGQTRKHFRILMIDDGSPDRSGEIAESYAKEYDFVDVIHQDNQGLAGAWNTGIKNTKTEWISFVDADDWVEPDYVETLCHAFENEASKFNVVLFDYYREYKNSTVVAKFDTKSGRLTDSQLLELKKAIFFRFEKNRRNGPYDAPVAWGKAYRTAFLIDNNILFTVSLRKGQDRAFNSELISRAGEVYYICKPIYHYVYRQDSRTNRYDKNVPNLVAMEIKTEQDVIKRCGLKDEVYEVHNCYIATRLYSCMRLYFFNDNNPEPYDEKVKKLSAFINTEPFKTALTEVNIGLLSSQEKLFVICIKNKMYWIASCLVKLKNWKTSKTLS